MAAIALSGGWGHQGEQNDSIDDWGAGVQALEKANVVATTCKPAS
jgi:hypothetical protein